jgi:hypothetical protein
MEGRGTHPKISARDMNAFSRAGTLILRTLGPRAAVRPITDMARQLGLDVDPEDAEALRQAEMDFDKKPEAADGDDNVVEFSPSA